MRSMLALRSLYFLSLALGAVAVHFSEENADQNKQNASSRGYSLPRPCEEKLGMFSNKNCCECTSKSGGHTFSEFNKYMDTCSHTEITEDKHGSTSYSEGKMCCAAWAVDCQPGDPVYEKGLKRDCMADKSECDANECHDIAVQYDAAVKAFKMHSQDVAPSVEGQYAHWHGTSNKHGINCFCACGDVVDGEGDEPQCKALSTSLLCRAKVRVCCSNLDDCEPTDPWPQHVANARTEVASKRSTNRENAAVAQQQISTLTGLLNECYSQCRENRKEQCLADLTTVVESDGGLFGMGKQKQAQQLITMETYYARLHAIAEGQNQKDQEEYEARDREWQLEKAERDKERNAARRERQLIDMQKFVMGGIEGAFEGTVDAMQSMNLPTSKRCCQCKMIERNTIRLFGNTNVAMDYCSAPDCSVYPSAKGGHACQAVDKRYCGSRYTACAGDINYYGRGGERDY